MFLCFNDANLYSKSICSSVNHSYNGYLFCFKITIISLCISKATLRDFSCTSRDFAQDFLILLHE